MKRHLLFHAIPAISLMIVSVSLCLASSPADSGFSSHAPRDFDRLNPAVSFFPNAITAIDCKTRVATISPSSFSTDDGGEARIYINGDTISFVQFATKHRFIMLSDTLSYLGFENRATLFSIDPAFARLRISAAEGDTLRTEWTGSVHGYGRDVLKATRGMSVCHTDSGWTLNCDGDTLRDVTRVVWDLELEYVNPDSIPAEAPDSVAAEAASDLMVDVERLLSERLLTRRTLWFADGTRYPVLQQTAVSSVRIREDGEVRDTVPVSQVCMYYPPSWQYADTGEELRLSPADRTGNELPENGYEEESCIYADEPVTDGETVTLSVSSSNGETNATVTLYSDSGFRLSEPVSVTLTSVPRTLSIPIPTNWKGVLLIRVDAGTDSLTRKTVI